jgi:acyl-CoA synthetase (AMP-forming)/AMP-acid ligase II
MNTFSDFAVDRLARPTSSRRNDIAVVDGERSVTYDELDRAANQVANGLNGRGLGDGGRVAYVGRSCLAGVELMLGSARAQASNSASLTFKAAR